MQAGQPLEQLVQGGLAIGVRGHIGQFAAATFQENTRSEAAPNVLLQHVGQPLHLGSGVNHIGHGQLAHCGLQHAAVLLEQAVPARWGQDAVCQVDGDLDLVAAIGQQVGNRQQVVDTRGQHGQRVQVDAHHAGEDHLKRVALGEAGL